MIDRLNCWKESLSSTLLKGRHLLVTQLCRHAHLCLSASPSGSHSCFQGVPALGAADRPGDEDRKKGMGAKVFCSPCAADLSPRFCCCRSEAGLHRLAQSDCSNLSLSPCLLPSPVSLPKRYPGHTATKKRRVISPNSRNSLVSVPSPLPFLPGPKEERSLLPPTKSPPI